MQTGVLKWHKLARVRMHLLSSKFAFRFNGEPIGTQAKSRRSSFIWKHFVGRIRRGHNMK